jgi:hypothetical protein
MVMQWLIGGVILATVGVLLRRVLHMETKKKSRAGELASLRADLETIYAPLAQEIETHTAILGITLNDAFSEREAKRNEMAWHVVRLAVGEWDRLTELVVGLQSAVSKFLPATNAIVPLRRVAVFHFKSPAVRDNVGVYEFLDQILFSSRSRFALRLRLLLRTSTTLRSEFTRACREGAITLDSSDELWTRLDYCFHDFDLLAKETLLALRTLLLCLSSEGARVLALDLQNLLERGTRVSVSSSNR